MTRYSKILAVFVTVASLAFMGFAIATTFGGPDWDAVMQADYFAEYKITFTPGENPTWNAVRGTEGEKIASSRRLPEVLSKVMDDVLKRVRQQTDAEAAREQPLQERIQLLTTVTATDSESLARFEEVARQRLSELRQQGVDVAAQVISATAEAQKLENVIASRREDILRLRQQSEELKADQFRLQQIQDQLSNELVQVRGDLERAKDRNEQLTSPTGR